MDEMREAFTADYAARYPLRALQVQNGAFYGETLEHYLTWQAALAHRDAQQWLPIESAPKDGTPILARHNRGTWKASKDLEKITYVVVWWDGQYFNQMGPDRFKDSELTHWQPLPTPPQEAKDE